MHIEAIEPSSQLTINSLSDNQQPLTVPLQVLSRLQISTLCKYSQQPYNVVSVAGITGIAGTMQRYVTSAW